MNIWENILRGLCMGSSDRLKGGPAFPISRCSCIFLPLYISLSLSLSQTHTPSFTLLLSCASLNVHIAIYSQFHPLELTISWTILLIENVHLWRNILTEIFAIYFELFCMINGDFINIMNNMIWIVWMICD